MMRFEILFASPIPTPILKFSNKIFVPVFFSGLIQVEPIFREHISKRPKNGCVPDFFVAARNADAGARIRSRVVGIERALRRRCLPVRHSGSIAREERSRAKCKEHRYAGRNALRVPQYVSESCFFHTVDLCSPEKKNDLALRGKKNISRSDRARARERAFPRYSLSRAGNSGGSGDAAVKRTIFPRSGNAISTDSA